MSIATTQSVAVAQSAKSQQRNRSLAAVTMLFFMWGFLTCLNDILVPHLKSVFDLDRTRVLAMQFAFFSPYLIFAMPAAKLVPRFGYQRTMAAGLLSMGMGAFLFIPAAAVPSYMLFLAALFALGMGVTTLQVAANPYVSLLGDRATAASRLTLTQAFNSLGTAIAPAFGRVLIVSAAPLTLVELQSLSPDAIHYARLAQAAAVRLPYALIGIALMALAVVIASIHLPVIKMPEQHAASHTHLSLWQHRNLVFGVAAIFTYVGAEVAIGGFLTHYFSHPEIGRMSARAAMGFVSLYWLGAMVGRFIGAALLQKIKTRTLLAICAGCAALLACISMMTTGHLAMWSIIAVGLFNSIMFPSIFTLGIDRLGVLTGQGSGALMMGIIGGAIVPVFQGMLNDRLGIHWAFVLPVLCYLYILFFAVDGSRPNRARA